MSIFQILILLLCSIIIINAIFKLIKKKISSLMFIIWTFFWLIISFVDVFPETLSWIATKAGIGRGVDLIIYLSIISLFYLIFKFNIRLKKHEEKISEMIQKLAIEKTQDNRTEK